MLLSLPACEEASPEKQVYCTLATPKASQSVLVPAHVPGSTVPWRRISFLEANRNGIKIILPMITSAVNGGAMIHVVMLISDTLL